MPSAEGPLLHRRRLGVELRRLRGDRTLEEVSEETLISTSKLSRLENGQGVPQARDIRDLVNCYKLDQASADRLRRWANAGRSQAWWRDSSEMLPANWAVYLDYESGASTIRVFAASVVPPLLQTAGYSGSLLRNLPPVKSEEAVQRLGEIRERRQELLFGADSTLRLIVVLDEAVLTRPIGTAEAMDTQLESLVSASRRGNIELTVVPFSAGAHAGVQGSFSILQYADDIDRDVVAVESHTGERLMERQADLLEYLRIFDAISSRTLGHDESRALIADSRIRLNLRKESRDLDR